MTNDKSGESAHHRMNNLWERAAIGILLLLLSVVQVQYASDKNDMKQEVKELNVKVLELYRTSVTKQELKELEDRLTKNVEGIRSDIRAIVQEAVRPRG